MTLITTAAAQRHTHHAALILIKQLSSITSIGLLSACVSIATAGKTPLDCSLPRPDTRINECNIVRNASEFSGCLKASDITTHSCILMDSDLRFCDNQPPLIISAIFDQSNKTLDCANGIIDHGWSKRSALPDGITATPRAQQMPFIRFYDDRSLSNITIKNCNMRGTFHAAMQLTRFFGGQLSNDDKLSPNESLPIGHNNITLENLHIEGGQVGIYLGNFSQDISMDRIYIDGTDRIALYSEAGSHRIRLTNSVISNNKTREAVAIDSTYDSEISNTLFVNNREGGINLYQNCGELLGSVCPIVRSTPPNGNTIINNTFVNNGISGLQLASRQGRNHTLGWCESLNGLPGQFHDTAQNNVIESNTFVCNEGTALVLMDGPNSVRNNHIVARDQCVPMEVSTGGLSSRFSSLLDGLSVTGTVLDSTRPPRLRNVGAGVRIE